MRSLKLSSPSKINLYLKVLGRRPDGYHELVTLFHRISLEDILTLRKSSAAFSLKVSDPRLPVDGRNLITKAYLALKKMIPDLKGVQVYLKKRIPVGAGLGGGSGNAAAFLLGMRKLYKLKVSTKRLAQIGAGLGADVPFFIYNYKQALGIGRGDKIIPKRAHARHWFILAVSQRGLSTKDVYGELRGFPLGGSLTRANHAVRMLCIFLEKRSYGQIPPLLENDLERAAFRLRPSLRRTISKFIKHGIKAARMTGSGPTIFGIVTDLREANRLAKKLRKDLPEKKILVCHSK